MYFGTFFWLKMCGFISGSSVPFIYMSDFIPILCYLCYYDPVLYFEISYWDTASSVKNVIGIFVGIALNL
jgi:hypothetical protein